MYYVYHISLSNIINEGYIGVTKNLESRFYNHLDSKYVVGLAIRKYDLTITSMKVLFEFETPEEAYAKENELRPNANIGWNIAPGGLGGARPYKESTRLLMSEKMSGENNPYYGKTHSSNIRNKISEKLLEKSSEWRTECASNAGKANKGKIRNDESKQKYTNVASNRPKYECPHCGKIGQYNSMISYHGNNCKLLKNKTDYE